MTHPETIVEVDYAEVELYLVAKYGAAVFLPPQLYSNGYLASLGLLRPNFEEERVNE